MIGKTTDEMIESLASAEEVEGFIAAVLNPALATRRLSAEHWAQLENKKRQLSHTKQETRR